MESKGGKTHFITVNGKEKKARKDFLWSGAVATKTRASACHAPFAVALALFSRAVKPLL